VSRASARLPCSTRRSRRSQPAALRLQLLLFPRFPLTPGCYHPRFTLYHGSFRSAMWA
ncbi:unnamed protein product, partial [Closterium sp. NIES-64]